MNKLYYLYATLFIVLISSCSSKEASKEKFTVLDSGPISVILENSTGLVYVIVTDHNGGISISKKPLSEAQKK